MDYKKLDPETVEYIAKLEDTITQLMMAISAYKDVVKHGEDSIFYNRLDTEAAELHRDWRNGKKCQYLKLWYAQREDETTT